MDAGQVAGDLVLMHGFWSSPATWDRFASRIGGDRELAGVGVHRFGYESPKRPRWPGSTVRIPDYDVIAQSLPAFLADAAPGGGPVAVVTHSQGGLILQRFLAWMLTEGRGEELARIRLVVMLACPNEGSEYLASIRRVVGFGRHPQARDLDVLSEDVTAARRVVLRQIVNAATVSARECPIPFYVYAGRSDGIVTRQSAQSVFPNAESLPGDHFSILHTDVPGNLTYPTIKRHLVTAFTHPAPPAPSSTAIPTGTPPQPPQSPRPPQQLPDAQVPTPVASGTASGEGGSSKYHIRIDRSSGIQIGDHNTQTNNSPEQP